MSTGIETFSKKILNLKFHDVQTAIQKLFLLSARPNTVNFLQSAKVVVLL